MVRARPPPPRTQGSQPARTLSACPRHSRAVFGADLLNEPHGARWDEWAAAAAELGDFVLSKCARWVVFVEGVAHKGMKNQREFFWGENLQDAASRPVRLRLSNKLVYSPHVYGPGDADEDHHMPYFDDKRFPANMEAIWERHFGYLSARGLTVVVGEWGGVYSRNLKDKLWQDRFADYLRTKGWGSFYWCLNPNSQDTGGLLTDSWTTPEAGKLQMLSRLTSTAAAPLLLALPAFECPVGDGAPRTPVFKCADGSACVLEQQTCNGYYECADRSDEAECAGTERPCVTVGGPAYGGGRPCVFPFSYNGFPYDACTHVDALDESVDGGGAWCATEVGANGEYLGHGHAGACGPGCPVAAPLPAQLLAERSMCDEGELRAGRAAHCGPSPPPPPLPPPSPSPPAPPPPPAAPPPMAPWLLGMYSGEEAYEKLAIGGGAAAALVLVCICIEVCCCRGGGGRGRAGRRSERRQRRVTAEELEALAGGSPKATRSAHGSARPGAARPTRAARPSQVLKPPRKGGPRQNASLE